MRRLGLFHLDTARLRIREWEDADQPPLDRLFSAPEVNRWFGLEELASAESRGPFIERMRRTQLVRGWAFWAVELRHPGGTEPLGPIGYVGFGTDAPPDPELGWTFLPCMWNRGYATEAGIAARDYGFSVLGMTRVVSVVDLRNLASARVAEKVGLVLRGSVECHGLEHLLYALEVDEWRCISGRSSNRDHS